jgi:hypothetical protein
MKNRGFIVLGLMTVLVAGLAACNASQPPQSSFVLGGADVSLPLFAANSDPAEMHIGETFHLLAPTPTPTPKQSASPTAKPTATPTAKPTPAPTASPTPPASPTPSPTAVVPTPIPGTKIEGINLDVLDADVVRLQENWVRMVLINRDIVVRHYKGTPQADVQTFTSGIDAVVFNYRSAVFKIRSTLLGMNAKDYSVVINTVAQARRELYNARLDAQASFNSNMLAFGQNYKTFKATQTPSPR